MMQGKLLIIQWQFSKENISSIKPFCICFSSDHNIRIDTNTNFRAGQRIHVTGKLKSIFKRTNDGKNLTVAFVKAEQLSILKGGSNPTSTDGDLNNVELISYVCDVKNTGMYSFLSLATHYKYV